MTIIRSGIKKEEFELNNNQKLLVEYSVTGFPDDWSPLDEDSLTDLKITSERRLSLFDESGKLIWSKIEDNPHQVKAAPGTLL